MHLVVDGFTVFHFFVQSHVVLGCALVCMFSLTCVSLSHICSCWNPCRLVRSHSTSLSLSSASFINSVLLLFNLRLSLRFGWMHVSVFGSAFRFLVSYRHRPSVVSLPLFHFFASELFLRFALLSPKTPLFCSHLFKFSSLLLCFFLLCFFLVASFLVASFLVAFSLHISFPSAVLSGQRCNTPQLSLTCAHSHQPIAHILCVALPPGETFLRHHSKAELSIRKPNLASDLVY